MVATADTQKSTDTIGSAGASATITAKTKTTLPPLPNIPIVNQGSGVEKSNSSDRDAVTDIATPHRIIKHDDEDDDDEDAGKYEEEIVPARMLDPVHLDVVLRASYVHRGGKSCLRHHAFLLSQQGAVELSPTQIRQKFIAPHLLAVSQSVNLVLRRLANFALDLIEAEDPVVIRAIKLPKGVVTSVMLSDFVSI